MCINLTFVCTKHNKYHTPLRGSEGAAFQALVHIHPECFKDGSMRVYHDGHKDTRGLDEFFPEHHSKALKFKLTDQELYQEYIELADARA